jgi:hypothetical protein
MLNGTTLLADELGRTLSATFQRAFGGGEPRMAALLDEAGRLIIERLVPRHSDFDSLAVSG